MMHKFWVLLKIEFLGLFAVSKQKKRFARRAMGAGAYVLLFLAVAIFIGGNQWVSAKSMADGFAQMGLPATPVLFMGLLLANVLVFGMGISLMPSHLFGFRDFDLLISMPLRPGLIMASKFGALYCFNLILVFLFGGPYLVAFGVCMGMGAGYYCLGVLLHLLMPLLPMVLSGLIAFLLGWLAAKSRMKNLVMIVGSVVVILLIMGVSMLSGLFSGMNGQEIQSVSAGLGFLASVNFMQAFYLPAMEGGNLLSALLFCLIEMGSFAAMVFVFQKAYGWINAKMKEQPAKGNFSAQEKKFLPKTKEKALAQKERKQFLSSYIYVLNSGMGLFMAFLGTVACLVFRLPILQLIAETNGFFEGYLFLLLGFFIALSNTAACSISFERQSFWMMQSFPLSPQQVIWGKVGLNLSLCLPVALVCGLALCLGLGIDVWFAAVLLLCLAGYALLPALLGMVENLAHPRLDYKNPVMAVKQSASVMAAVLWSMLISIVPLVAYPFAILFLPPVAFFGIWAAVLLLLDLLFYRTLKKKGAARFAAIAER